MSHGIEKARRVEHADRDGTLSRPESEVYLHVQGDYTMQGRVPRRGRSGRDRDYDTGTGGVCDEQHRGGGGGRAAKMK
jgi:hypothetical protein